MSKNKYVLLCVTAISALMMIGANASMGIIKIPELVTSTPASNQAAVGNNAPKSDFPSISLEKTARGEEIIAALGDKLPEVARWYRISEEELKEVAKDRSLRVDRKGRLFFSDEEVVTSGDIASINTGNLTSGGVLPLEQTFQLHSKPGSSKTLYLDFNGHYFAAGKSAWISSEFNAPGFDIDGNPGSFSDAERQIIQNVWLRVAEDFVPYDVDVTTEEPTADRLERTSTSDSIYGNRVLFTQSGGTLRPGAGGSSYVGVFDDVGEMYKTALVFPEMLAYSDKYMGEAGSHEAGHSLGLWHDGVSGATEYYYGQGDWAPTMGVGYYKNIVQWSKGDYTSPSNTQDDLQVMQTYGLSYRADDYGNTISSAGNATIVGNSLSAAGIIERTNDVDFLKFNSGAGEISISVGVAYVGASLDAHITLYNGSGQVIASQDLPGLNTSVSANVPGGTYYIAIKGVGAGNPLTDGYSNYGSLGQYYVTGNIVGTNNNPPIAVASANPTAGGAPLTVQFSSTGSFDPDGGGLSYNWNFGDNTASTEPNPVKTYENGGNYTAMLTVTDSNNLSASQSVQISAVNQAPVASFTTSYSSTNIPMTVNFDASASSDPDGFVASYMWDFGDGALATGVTASHTYTNAGPYIAKLTVTDGGGLSSSKSISFTAVDPNVIAAPTSLSASATGKTKNQVVLKWTDRSSNESIFFIERAIYAKSGTPTYQVVGQVGANVTTYTDSVPANTYYYRVRAYNGQTDKYSSYSNATQVRVR